VACLNSGKTISKRKSYYSVSNVDMSNCWNYYSFTQRTVEKLGAAFLLWYLSGSADLVVRVDSVHIDWEGNYVMDIAFYHSDNPGYPVTDEEYMLAVGAEEDECPF
jgi:hypothetical protein